MPPGLTAVPDQKCRGLPPLVAMKESSSPYGKPKDKHVEPGIQTTIAFSPSLAFSIYLSRRTASLLHSCTHILPPLIHAAPISTTIHGPRPPPFHTVAYSCGGSSGRRWSGHDASGTSYQVKTREARAKAACEFKPTRQQREERGDELHSESLSEAETECE